MWYCIVYISINASSEVGKQFLASVIFANKMIRFNIRVIPMSTQLDVINGNIDTHIVIVYLLAGS